LTEGCAFLAYEDLDWTNGWEPVGRKQVDPGPQRTTEHRRLSLGRNDKGIHPAASKFRYTQMPDHPDLSDQDLDNLYSYFQHQDQHRTQHSNSQ
jgi:hypothetical protein